MNEDEREQTLEVIADFLELGHVENIAAMFRQDRDLYGLAGRLVRDGRFTVRLGTAVLFEILARERPDEAALAVPAIAPLLGDDTAYVRGEAANVLGIIGTPAALELLRGLADDPEPQVREIAADFLEADPCGRP